MEEELKEINDLKAKMIKLENQFARNREENKKSELQLIE